MHWVQCSSEHGRSYFWPLSTLQLILFVIVLLTEINWLVDCDIMLLYSELVIAECCQASKSWYLYRMTIWAEAVNVFSCCRSLMDWNGSSRSTSHKCISHPKVGVGMTVYMCLCCSIYSSHSLFIFIFLMFACPDGVIFWWVDGGISLNVCLYLSSLFISNLHTGFEELSLGLWLILGWYTWERSSCGNSRGLQ